MNYIIKKIKQNYKSSLTIEASLIITIFIFAFICFLFILDYIRINNIVIGSIQKNVLEYMNYAYAKNKVINKTDNELLNEIVNLSSDVYVVRKINADIKEHEKMYSLIYDGFDVSKSKILDGNGYIEIIVKYKLKTPFNIIGRKSVNMSNRLFAHGFVGYEELDLNLNDIYVYITENGTVYHEDINCSYLNIKVTPVSISDIPNLRNSNGGKYNQCLLCKKIASSNTVYISNYGDKYHMISNCSAITRDIKKVKLSTVGNRRGCSKCVH